MQADFLKVWNISGIVDDGKRVKLVDKTSNGLECYNHHFMVLFLLLTLTQSLSSKLYEKKSIEFLQEWKILTRAEKILQNMQSLFPEIPSDFWEMIESHKEMCDEKVKDVAKKKG